ncbi:hypothetical protein IF129_22705 [Streptomyces chumphonensis]|uniref:Uncharacterized protein n=1 Tax=Streptomyces chumphonensis TaxID=1214925 RepID=A0A927F2I7_9ACTN|nr:hypothetical protein [Streptomyces chumphonensis]MBD3934359.1 hypothetical protein [Streptomyces chumphonensis]
MPDGKAQHEETVETSSVARVDAQTKEVSSQLLDIIDVSGRVSEPGPGVTQCDQSRSRERYFRMNHSWSVSSQDTDQLGKAMRRLLDKLPKQGWEVVSYGPNNSTSKTLTLIADHPAKRFGTNIEFWERRPEGKTPGLLVTVVSGCYAVPEGEHVEHY